MKYFKRYSIFNVKNLVILLFNIIFKLYWTVYPYINEQKIFYLDCRKWRNKINIYLWKKINVAIFI